MNSLFDDFNKNGLQNQFAKFMEQMQGQNPNEVINNLLKSGKITQAQLDIAQQKARDMQGVFNMFKK